MSVSGAASLSVDTIPFPRISVVQDVNNAKEKNEKGDGRRRRRTRRGMEGEGEEREGEGEVND